MKERLNKLLTVKSIVTLFLAVVFCVLSIKGVISGQEFLTVFTTVIAFYYGTQSTKNVNVESAQIESAVADVKKYVPPEDDAPDVL